MFTALRDWLFDPAGLTPHGFCLIWDPGLIWAYAISDMSIGVAYFSIPLALAIFAKRRRDMEFRPIFILFASFIFLCGATHVLDVVTLWLPAYGLQATVKMATAIASIITAIALWRLLPQALALPSPAQLADAHAALRRSEERLRQSQKMEAVGQLTGGVAHDVNNMLQVIAASLELLERRIAQKRFTEIGRFMEGARQGVTKASALTYQMLAFARRQTLQPRSVKPETLVKGMLELLCSTVGPAIRVELKAHDGAWSALCDPNQLESALLNLAINARDAMPHGGTLSIATADRELGPSDITGEEDAEPGRYSEIAVTDTGVGMPPDVREHAFEPFFTTKPIGEGTGLGLPQVYGFVRQSGGFVRLESTPGEGTTVRLYLPYDAGRDVGQDIVRGNTTVMGHNQVSMRPRAQTVLVVDDEEAIRVMIAEALREDGYFVLEAKDGESALRMFQRSEQIDILVSDVGLPGINGRQLAEAGREKKPNLPVLLITGYAGKAFDESEIPTGMEVMFKPFAIGAVVAKVNEILTDPAIRVAS